MSTTPGLSLPEAARHLGVSLRALRHAMRAGKIPSPPHLTATATLSPEWLANAEAAIAATPKLFTSAIRQKVPPFARYEGTSAWRKYPNRVRERAHFQASAHQTAA